MDDFVTDELIQHWDLTIKKQMMDGTFQSVPHKLTINWFNGKYFEGVITQPQNNVTFKVRSGFASHGPYPGVISFEVIVDDGTVRRLYGDIIDAWTILGHKISTNDNDMTNARWSAFRYEKNYNVNEISIFEVNAYGTISLVGCYKPEIRADFYDIGDYDTRTPKHLVAAAKEHPPLQWLIADCYTEYRKILAYPARLISMPENSDEEWIDWVVGADDQTFSTLIENVNKWLSEEPNWDFEDDYFVVSGDPERAAFELLKDEPYELLDALGIDIIEGDRPGSNYCGAELSRPIEKANTVAEVNGLEYRFQKKTDL